MIRAYALVAVMESGTLALSGGAGASVPLSGTEAVPPALAVSTTSAVPGQSITVTVANGPGNRADFLAIFAAGAPDTAPTQWKYLDGTTTIPPVGRTTASVTFTPPSAGAWNFRLFRNDTVVRLAISVDVIVAPRPLLSVAPTSIDFGGVAPGAYADRQVRLSNAGGGILSGEATVNGAAFSIIGPAAYSLAAGESTTVTVRYAPVPSTPAPPDTFVIAGQSNAQGHGLTLNAYARGPRWAWKMDRENDSSWLPLDDPVDPAGAGSPWPIIGTEFLRSQGRDVYFIPCAVGGTTIAQWQPGGELYARMVARARRVPPGRLRAVLWWQGEADALAGTTTETYFARLSVLAAAIQSDLGVKMIPAKLQHTPEYAAGLMNVNEAIARSWIEGGNFVPGPDLSDLSADEGFHLRSDANIRTAALRWWHALADAYGWGR